MRVGNKHLILILFIYLVFSATGFLGGESPKLVADGQCARPGEWGFGTKFRWFVYLTMGHYFVAILANSP
jgi:hypothetical protein